MSVEAFARRRSAPSSTQLGGALLGVALVAAGLLAGLFYAWSCSVMPGLADTDDRTFVAAMQAMNEAIRNPAFFATFVGTIPLLVASLLAARRAGARTAALWLAAALALNLLGLLITGAFNIPLNDDLERAGADVAQARDDFETPWVVWNIVRTVVYTASFCCVACAFGRRRRTAA